LISLHENLHSFYNACASNQKIKIAYGSFSAIAEKGFIVISPMLTRQDVLNAPNLFCSSQLAKDKNCQINSFRSHYILEFELRKDDGSAKES
jgi:hypothetical protein